MPSLSCPGSAQSRTLEIDAQRSRIDSKQTPLSPATETHVMYFYFNTLHVSRISENVYCGNFHAIGILYRM